MKITVNQTKQLIRESVKEQLAQLREKSEENKKDQARGIIALLQDEADTLNQLAETARKMYEEKQYSELKREAESLEKVRDSKLSKIKAIESKYGISDSNVDEGKKKKKKPTKPKSKSKSKPTNSTRIMGGFYGIGNNDNDSNDSGDE